MVLLACFFACALGHAKLVTPLAWNANPSKTSPCGGGTAPTVEAASWDQGSTQTVTWTVVAGDGAGQLNLYFDPAGTTTFTGAAIPLGAPANVGTYEYTFTVPTTLVCTGPGSLCTAQVNSSSGWFACSSVKILAANTPPVPPPPPVCTIPTELVFCLSRNRHNIQIPAGQKPNAVDKSISGTYAQNVKNVNVFANGNDTACQNAYKEFLCSSGLPACGTTTACKSLCRDALQTCGIQPSHADLYKCDDGPDDCNSAISFGVSLALLFFLSFLA